MANEHRKSCLALPNIREPYILHYYYVYWLKPQWNYNKTYKMAKDKKADVESVEQLVLLHVFTEV